MLDDLAVVVEAKDVHPGVVVVAGPLLEAMKDYTRSSSATARLNSTRLSGYSVAILSK